MNNTSQFIHIFHKDTNNISYGEELTILPNSSFVNVDISGTASGFLIKFDGKIDNDSEWRLINGVNLTTMDLLNSTTTLNSIYQFDLTGLFKFRINIESITSGTVTAIGRVVN
jgi:hypothetical protein